MAFESKMFIVMMAKIVKEAKNLEDVYKTLSHMASIDGVKLEPFDESKEEEED